MNNDREWEEFVVSLNKITNINLQYYKRPQMERRINGFMHQQGISKYKDFLELLRTDKVVCEKFVLHLTINVSEFFRNPTNWQSLENEILPELRKERGGPLKIWSAGCSTGEEPYSLAMLVKEKNIDIKNHILATDLDLGVLDKAKKGEYTEKEAEGVPPAWRKKYLNFDGKTYTVTNDIKKMIRFNRQDLLKDSFETDFDLILCRNVVIYFTEESKKVLYSKFVNALRTKGALFVGSTEQIFNARDIGLVPKKIFFYIKQ